MPEWKPIISRLGKLVSEMLASTFQTLKSYWLVWMLTVAIVLEALPFISLGFDIWTTEKGEPKWWIGKLESLGHIVLASAIFSAIAKSAIFLEIFKTVISDDDFKDSIRKSLVDVSKAPCFNQILLAAIREEASSEHSRAVIQSEVLHALYDEKCLEAWERKLEPWRKLTRAVSGAKFPGIQEAIEEKITAEFFTRHDCYLREYRIMLTIKLEPDGRIRITEYVKFEVVPSSSSETIFCTFKMIKPDPQMDFTLKKLEVDYRDRKNEFDQNELRYSFPFGILPDDRSHHEVIRETVRVRPLVHPVEGSAHCFRFQKFVKNFTIDIHHSADLTVFLTERGSIDILSPVSIEQSADMKSFRWEYKGVLFPKWGLHLGLIKSESSK